VQKVCDEHVAFSVLRYLIKIINRWSSFGSFVKSTLVALSFLAAPSREKDQLISQSFAAMTDVRGRVGNAVLGVVEHPYGLFFLQSLLSFFSLFRFEMLRRNHRGFVVVRFLPPRPIWPPFSRQCRTGAGRTARLRPAGDVFCIILASRRVLFHTIPALLIFKDSSTRQIRYVWERFHDDICAPRGFKLTPAQRFAV